MPGPTIPPTLAKAFIAFLSVLVVLAALFGFLLFGPFDIFSDINKMADLLNESRGGSDRGRPSSPEVAPSLAREVSDAEPVMVDITTEPRIVSFDNPGESVRLTLRGYYSDGTVGQLAAIPGAELTFTSTDPDVAQVSSDGVVTGVEAGGVDVEVSYGGFTAEVPVLVFEPFEPLPAIDPERVVPNADDGTAIVLNQLMVEVQSGVSELDADSIAASIGGRIVYRFESFSGVVIENDARTEAELNEALITLEGDPRVVTAYPDVLFESSQGPISTGIETLDNFGNDSAYVQSGMKEAWELLNSSKVTLDPVVIAVIDTAFPIDDTERVEHYLLNEEFDRNRIRVEKMRNKVTELFPADSHHGVAVTSVIAARNNSPNLGGISGVISSVDKLPYHVVFFEVGEVTVHSGQAITRVSEIQVDVALDRLNKVSKRIDVVNMSMRRRGQKRVWRIEIQRDSDITYVVGAGNDGIDIKKDFSPASFTLEAHLSAGPGRTKTWPKLDNVITVAGTSNFDSFNDGTREPLSKCRVGLHPESNFGDAIILGAPYLVRTLNTEYGGFTRKQGTSFSAPLVSGTVALLKAIDKDLPPGEVKTILSGTGKDVCDDKGNIVPWKALDAGAAVKYVLKNRPTPTPTPQPRATVPIATPAQVPTNTPARISRPVSTVVPAAGMVLYRDLNDRYTIEVPDGWEKVSEPYRPNHRGLYHDHLEFSHPDNSATIQVSAEWVNAADWRPRFNTKIRGTTASPNGGQYIEYSELNNWCRSGLSEGIREEIVTPWARFVVLANACQIDSYQYKDLLWSSVKSFTPAAALLANNGTVLYRDLGNRYTLEVPAGWKKVSDPYALNGYPERPFGRLSFEQPDGKAYISVGEGLLLADRFMPHEVTIKRASTSPNRGEYIELKAIARECRSGFNEGILEEIKTRSGHLVVMAFACQENFDQYEPLLWDIIRSFTPGVPAAPTNSIPQAEPQWSRNGVTLRKAVFFAWASQMTSPDHPECSLEAIIHSHSTVTPAVLDEYLQCLPESDSIVSQENTGLYWVMAFDATAATRNLEVPLKTLWFHHPANEGEPFLMADSISVLEVDVSSQTGANSYSSQFNGLYFGRPIQSHFKAGNSYEARVLDDRGEVVFAWKFEVN